MRDDQGKETNETEHLTGHEEYFEIHYYLLGSKNGSEINLPAGEHSYPFTCALPPTLPSSFEGEWGHVRYTIKVTLDRPWKFDQDAKMAFTVVSPVDLNVNPRLKVCHMRIADFLVCIQIFLSCVFGPRRNPLNWSWRKLFVAFAALLGRCPPLLWCQRPDSCAVNQFQLRPKSITQAT